MISKFEDRVSTHKNRYRVVPQGDSSPFYAYLERADEPTVPGTPLNAETMNGILDEVTLYKQRWAEFEQECNFLLEHCNSLLPTESSEYPGCYYRTVGDETEWVNPPMIRGVEYRTTERMGGHPIYVKRLDITLPDLNQTMQLEIVRSENPGLVNIDGSILDDLFEYWYTYPFINAAGPCVEILVHHASIGDETYALMLSIKVRETHFAGGSGSLYFKYTKGTN